MEKTPPAVAPNPAFRHVRVPVFEPFEQKTSWNPLFRSRFPFSDLVQLGDLTKMKSVQFQVVVSYYLPGSDAPFTTTISKAAKLSLPKFLT